MDSDSYSISIEREGIRCTNDGKISALKHSQIFTSKNRFINTTDLDCQLSLNTPFCKNVSDCFDKLEEIMNVVFNELHNKDEMIWPCSKLLYIDDKKYFSKIYMNFCLDKKCFQRIREINNKVPKDINQAYLKIKNQFIKKSWMLSYLLKKIPTTDSSVPEEMFWNNENVSIEIVSKNDNYLRIILSDINLFEKCGISKNDLSLLVTFILYCLTSNENEDANYNLGDNFKIDDFYRQEIDKLFKNLLTINDDFGLLLNSYVMKIYDEFEKNTTDYDKLEGMLKDSKLEDVILEFALKHSADGYNSRYCLKTCPNLLSEAVALIKDALSVGIDYNIINRKKGIIEFINEDGHKEYIVDGNETKKDSYIFPIITDDKYLVKNILSENNLYVPYGILIDRYVEEERKNLIVKSFLNKPVVIKPRNTNFGTGITIFPKGSEEADIRNAIEYAFKFDDDVLIEDFVEGEEYRFLVIGGRCDSVVFRRSASVVGDGHSTIKKLINEKNKEPWHYLTETPVIMDETVEEILKEQEYTYNSIIEKSKRIFLRKVSNCSVGGESIDVTNLIPCRFKKIAEKATKCFNAKISGVDIIIKDLNKCEYSIIEINDTPGYAINEWPYEGSGRRVGLDILELLGMF